MVLSILLYNQVNGRCWRGINFNYLTNHVTY